MSHFPITIRYTDTGEEITINTPEEIKSGRAFKVLATRVKK